MCRNVNVAAPTYQELICMLNKAESEAADGAVSVAELLTTKFGLLPTHKNWKTWSFFGDGEKDCWPSEELKGSARRSYMKRQWTPRTRNMMCLGECLILCCTCTKFYSTPTWYALKRVIYF